jgi:hypothetical protein
MLLGAFFDVQNLMEVASRVKPPRTVDTGISPVDFGLARSNDGGRVGSLPPATGVTVRPRRRRDLEEEIEAQEGQGVCARKRASTLQTIFTDNASKVPASKRAASVCQQWRRRFGVSEDERHGGQGSG